MTDGLLSAEELRDWARRLRAEYQEIGRKLAEQKCLLEKIRREGEAFVEECEDFKRQLKEAETG